MNKPHNTASHEGVTESVSWDDEIVEMKKSEIQAVKILIRDGDLYDAYALLHLKLNTTQND